MGIYPTAIDAIRQGVGAVGGPLFQSVKEMVKAFNLRAFTKTDDLRDWGARLGDHINEAFLHGVDAVKHWYPIVKQFAETMYEHLHATWMRLAPVIQQVLGKVEDFMQDPAAFNKLVHAAEMFAGARAAGGVAEMGFGALSAGGGILKGAEAIGGGAGLAGGLEAIGAVAGPAALAIAALAAGVYGAIDIITDSTAPFHDWAVDVLGTTAFMFKDLGVQAMEFGHHLKPIAQILGADLIGLLAIVVTYMDMFATVINKVISGFEWLLHSINDVTMQLLGLKKPMGPEEPIDVARIATVAAHVIGMNATAEPEKARKIPTHVTNIHHVEIKVAPNPDPNRVAKRTAEILMDIQRNPKVALLTGAPVLSR